jgi:hypothetical protein
VAGAGQPTALPHLPNAREPPLSTAR